MRDALRALWTLLRALRGAWFPASDVAEDNRVAEAISQQRAVAGDVHSRKVDPRAVVAAARRRELAATFQYEFDTDTDAIAWLIGEGK